MVVVTDRQNNNSEEPPQVVKPPAASGEEKKWGYDLYPERKGIGLLMIVSFLSLIPNSFITFKLKSTVPNFGKPLSESRAERIRTRYDAKEMSTSVLKPAR